MIHLLYGTLGCFGLFFFFFKQKTAYEMRISDWSSDVCSSDLTNICWFRAVTFNIQDKPPIVLLTGYRITTRIEQYTVGNIDGGLDWASIVQSTEAFAFKVDHDFTCIFTMGSTGKTALARPTIDDSGC